MGAYNNTPPIGGSMNNAGAIDSAVVLERAGLDEHKIRELSHMLGQITSPANSITCSSQNSNNDTPTTNTIRTISPSVNKSPKWKKAILAQILLPPSEAQSPVSQSQSQTSDSYDALSETSCEDENPTSDAEFDATLPAAMTSSNSRRNQAVTSSAREASLSPIPLASTSLSRGSENRTGHLAALNLPTIPIRARLSQIMTDELFEFEYKMFRVFDSCNTSASRESPLCESNPPPPSTSCTSASVIAPPLVGEQPIGAMDWLARGPRCLSTTHMHLCLSPSRRTIRTEWA